VTYLQLLNLAERSTQGREAVRAILELIGAVAYRDVGEPFGTAAMSTWLLALLDPKTWKSHPRWVQALENRLEQLRSASVGTDTLRQCDGVAQCHLN